MGYNAPAAPSPPASAFGEERLEFPDNRRLIDLCGQYDRNLAHIEAKLGVQLVRRGNMIAVMGDAEARHKAVELLRMLYQKLDPTHGLETGAIDAVIRLGGPANPATSDNQLEMFRAGRFELRTRKKPVEPRTEAQKAYVANLFKHELVFGIGPAGTGKTYLAVAAAVTHFIAGEVEKIILSRPAVEAGERLGFLPGDMKDKVDPYMQPLYDALNDFLPGREVQKLIEDKKIEIAPLAFMRGRTLANAFVVLDEAQNATALQMKMFLTRLGEGSRMVITGDRSQVDLPRGVPSGLTEAERILGNVKNISFNYFTSKDVVRHPMVARIIEAYDQDDARTAG